MRCTWCGKELNNDFGYSETGEIICCSYSTPTTKTYNACKARKNRRIKREATMRANESEKTASEASSHIVDRLTEALQIIINQNDELIALQRQQLNAPKPQIVTNTKVISTTTFEAPEDMDFDIEIKQDTSTTSSKTFLDQMKAMQAGEGVWAKKDMKQ